MPSPTFGLSSIRWWRSCFGSSNSRRGWFIADLHCHTLPYYGFRLLCRAAGWHRIVRLDGTVSIARGFRPPEWRALLARSGLNASISWHLLFRLCVGRQK
jgi:hypothetical protein